MRANDRGTDARGGEARGESAEARQAAEKLLLVDELEDTLERARDGGEPPDRVRALERRLSAERASVRDLERRGALRYEEMARAMEAVDRSG